ncbi:uncharacterized protein LOC110368217 isoform X1 [Fundulus heteroclitus]|uniref:uncharacterized protein LOC110368217 isoform X1 n=2 Tax=Fundulus heteroclitus TaxID=8078 RepID=UPI00165A2DD2|nr:uncharacterized protein LOC110368217 isoform X1 [Fundulus heteroclitus]XP_035988973.1 uncharacterized protein LOC110368217 isoform X1 [Fundulus heteroclitus]XP_035988974.1 uncharacterized protein LOC110368217 isoform X1 [Fundulus heteroclitus]
MDEINDFLRSRDVSEEVIQQLEKDKIDSSVIPLMTDEQLKVYLPSYGDRLALLGYCRRRENDPAGRKSKLLDRLRAKISRNKSKDHREVAENETVKNAQKNVRKVELGWLNFRDGKYSQVRTKKGGGTRKVAVSKDCRKNELVEKAVGLFFPAQRNTQGRITDFEVDITDFQEHSLDEHITVGELYEQTKLPLLRFYLTTKRKDSASDSETESASANAQQDVIYVGNSSVLTNSSSDDIHLVYSTVDMGDLSSVHEIDAAMNVDILEDSGTVTFFTGRISNTESASLDDTLLLSPQSSSPVVSSSHLDSFQEPIVQREKVKKILVLHRGQILKELISHFCDVSVTQEDISIQVVLPDGKQEKAIDDGGVLRDVLSEFWQDFYEQCTLGNNFKVPFLRHDFGQQQWESIGRIIAFGWQKQKYLPIKLAPVILEQAALGCIKSPLVDSFLRYVTESDRIVFESCRSDFESVDSEELLEIMDLHNCRRVPTADNFELLLEELAHQKLIQEPAFVIEQWSTVLSPLRSELECITAAYENLQPTFRKVMRSLVYPTIMTEQQKNITKYLSSYLRESDKQHLSLFLRFCTGSDLFLGRNISISFTQLQGVQRRPVAHTCGCYLELPVNYENYPDFRHEINKVLESSVWVMDIV